MQWHKVTRSGCAEHKNEAHSDFYCTESTYYRPEQSEL
jgi:hypothetical protein